MNENKENSGFILSIILVLILNIIVFFMAKIILFYPAFFESIFSRCLFEMVFPIIMLPLTLYFCNRLQISKAQIGLTTKNFLKSFLVGLLVSFFLLIVFGIHHVYSNTQTIILRFFYYLFCISSVEEIVFRGFVRQNICKDKKRAYLLTGILFSLSHIPFHLTINNLDLFWFILNRVGPLIFYIIVHYILQIIYDKYENCTGPIVIHFVIDFFGVFAK